MLAQTGDNSETTGASVVGVKVRITRQRMVGRIARHGDTDIAAGVTTGRPWPHASDLGAAAGYLLSATACQRTGSLLLAAAIGFFAAKDLIRMVRCGSSSLNANPT